jgi:DNA-binding MarR family transcriptional regulator
MFHMKRAHLSALASARELSSEMGLTPARFDLMRAVVAFGSTEVQKQSKLWRALGISRASGSRMVRKLMGLGLLGRVRCADDRRTFVVSLTAEGERRLREGTVRLLVEQPLQSRYESAFGTPSPSTSRAVQNLESALRTSARHLGDRSWNLYLSRASAPAARARGGSPRRREPAHVSATADDGAAPKT